MMELYEEMMRNKALVDKAAELLKCDWREVPKKIAELKQNIVRQDKEIERLKQRIAERK